MERLLEDILFDAPLTSPRELCVDKAYVENKLNAMEKDEDLRRYIL